MYCYPGKMVGLYDPPEIEKEECRKGIPCNFGICAECTIGTEKEDVYDETKTDTTVANSSSGGDNNWMW